MCMDGILLTYWHVLYERPEISADSKKKTLTIRSRNFMRSLLNVFTLSKYVAELYMSPFPHKSWVCVCVCDQVRTRSCGSSSVAKVQIIYYHDDPKTSNGPRRTVKPSQSLSDDHYDLRLLYGSQYNDKPTTDVRERNGSRFWLRIQQI